MMTVTSTGVSRAASIVTRASVVLVLMTAVVHAAKAQSESSRNAVSVRVERRGAKDAISGLLRGASSEGLVIDTSPTLVTVPWIDIARVEGDTDPAWSRCLDSARNLWRGVYRLQRSDMRLAWEAFAAAASGGCTGEVQRAACEGMVVSMSQDSQENRTRIASLIAAKLDRDGVREAGSPLVRAAFPLDGVPAPGFAPAWGDLESAQEFMALSGTALGIDAVDVSDPVMAAFIALARQESGGESVMPERKLLGKPLPEWFAPLLDAWHDACSVVPARRMAGRTALALQRGVVDEAWRPWITYARGRSLAMDARESSATRESSTARDSVLARDALARTGVALADDAALELITAAAEAGLGTSLGRAALSQAARCLRTADDEASALLIERDLAAARGRSEGAPSP
ncbi:MAG: hypothetical protein EXS00_02735 [Phycisphaerales bacterium]|nr:hypothetical protein [Phycisphaerales bacterium]